ncbi:hypothetical protein [Blautia producta]|uniref:DUF3267 domain-containing protein n=1 Tax=Blautia producta TaxID=33035 RepID=A0A4P6LVZ3_9FIRM|nr:hypothetical protein [Blautia producta]QBE95945.1 hypothetical protein PMF13cell1_01471 [Blautia producta]
MNNEGECLLLEKASPIFVTRIILNYLKYPIGFTIVLSIVILLFTTFKAIVLVIQLNAILFLGIVLSSVFHEYMHMFYMKKFGVKNVIIKTTMYKFAIIPKEDILQSSRLIITAASGGTICIIVAFILKIIEIVWLGSLAFIDMICLIYILHIINLIPIFGDGQMILKGIKELKRGSSS